jgi:glycine cleavage system H protein
MEKKDRKYLASHEWVKIDGDRAIVGISNHAQEELGDVTYVEPPAVGTSVVQGEECGSIESVKAASDLFSPLSGTVAAVNDELESTPEVINSDPYDAGWIFKIRDFDEAELASLLDAEQYQEVVESDQ